MSSTSTLRNGGWLNRRRVVVYGIVLLALESCIAGYFALMAHGVLGPIAPNSTDFLSFYAAGRLADLGQPAAVYDIAVHQAMQRQVFGDPALAGVFYFFYPPVFLLPCALLAHLPYSVALALWDMAMLAIYVAALASLSRDRLLVLAFLSFPPLFLALGLGQNACLTAGLLAGGLVLLERRPGLAGVLFGCLCYKPHFLLLVPVALLAGRHWRALGACILTGAVLVSVSLALFGPGTWQGFLGIVPYADHYFAGGEVGYWSQVSIQAAARILGLGLVASDILQGMAMTLALTVTMLVWIGRSSMAVRAVVLVAATLLALPVGHAYDLVSGVVGIAWLLRRARETGFLPGEKLVLLLLWFVPIFGISLLGTHVVQRYGMPVLPLFAIGLLALALRRAFLERKEAPSLPTKPFLHSL